MWRKIKLRKLTSVIVLTVLIWVWADLALERDLKLNTIPLRIEPSNDPALWVAFDVNDQYYTIVLLDSMKLKGPEAAIRDMDRNLRSKMKFSFVPAEQGLSQPGSQIFNVLNYLNQTVSEEYGLAVESCEPEVLTVRVEVLKEMTVPVRCYDKKHVLVERANTQPAEVTMFLPETGEGEPHEAIVSLTDEEIARLRGSAQSTIPYVEFFGQRKEASVSVRVSLPDIEEDLAPGVIGTPKLGFVMSQNMSDRFSVELTSTSRDHLAAISVRATGPAYQAYLASSFHLLLQIEDKDAPPQGSGEITITGRKLRYNLPIAYAGQIQLDDHPKFVSFKLIPKTGMSTTD